MGRNDKVLIINGSPRKNKNCHSVVKELVKKFESEIKKETLTENIVFNTQRNTYTEVSINGEKLMLDVEVVK